MDMAKLIIMYPMPAGIEKFERPFNQEHSPLTVDNLDGKSYFVHSLIIESSPGNDLAPYHRIAEIHFSSIVELETWLNFPVGRKITEHAFEISTGGSSLLLAAEFEPHHA